MAASQVAGADAWVNGPYMSDTHNLWAEIEAAAPAPRKKRPESTPREKAILRQVLTDRQREKQTTSAAPSEASSSNSKQPTGKPARSPSPGKNMPKSPSAKKVMEAQSPSAVAAAAAKKGKHSDRKAKTHRPRSASPAKRRPGALPQDGMGRLVQPAWNATQPPRRAPGEVINKWNHQGLMQEGEEAAAGWKPTSNPQASGFQSARSDRSAASGVSAYSTASARLSRVTTSPSTHGHPNADRRADLRGADMMNNINYYATTQTGRVASSGDPVYIAPDNDRKMKEASWVGHRPCLLPSYLLPPHALATTPPPCYRRHALATTPLPCHCHTPLLPPPCPCYFPCLSSSLPVPLLHVAAGVEPGMVRVVTLLPQRGRGHHQ